MSFAQHELEKVKSLPISQHEKDQILGGNIARILKLTFAVGAETLRRSLGAGSLVHPRPD